MGEQLSISKYIHVAVAHVCNFVYLYMHWYSSVLSHCCAVRTDLSHRCVGDMYTLIGIAIMICLMQDGATPLFIASQRGLTEVVNLLITHGASLDKQHKVDSYCDDYDLVYFDEIIVSRTKWVHPHSYSAILVICFSCCLQI